MNISSGLVKQLSKMSCGPKYPHHGYLSARWVGGGQKS